MKNEWRAIVRWTIAALGLTTLVASGGLREDEIDCEQAVAHLQECCPGFTYDATLSCEYSDGCGVWETALSIPESKCILAMSCDDLLANDLCARTANLEQPNTNMDGEVTSHAPVCP